MSRDNDSLYKNPRMRLRENICKQYEHWNPESNKKIKDCLKELKSIHDEK
jgi:hypothetical protein